jgi:hypothetical protein
MKHHVDRPENEWLDNLDAIINGDALPPQEDEELLHVATRLASALAPLRTKARDEAAIHPHLHPYLLKQPRRRTLRLTAGISRAGLLVAAMLFLACIIVLGSATGIATLWQGATRALHASTSLDQINGVSIASLARPHPGLRPLPLLPAVLPANTQAATYGVLTDASDPNVMTTFVADYRINGQDVQVYEQPSDLPFLSTTAQAVQIGTRQGQLFSDNAGNHALQWYQNAMLCQLTSTLPVAQLIKLASVFQPIKSWDLIH